jgi:hypothetical protein
MVPDLEQVAAVPVLVCQLQTVLLELAAFLRMRKRVSMLVEAG